MKTIIICLVLLFSNHAFSQNSEQQVIKALTENDSVFWTGYNTCNLEVMSRFLSSDMEFYHDQGGITLGIEEMMKSMQKNICKDPNRKVRRELVPGTFQLFLLKDNNIIYGAILSGDHYFYNSHGGGKETKDGIAKFTHLWLLQDGTWKMNRILSFDHKGL
ncbi:MAG TPA: nuclear transport factor 2 family protein [Prolixibacteraceae bacterium]|nr:nuclear transport factor 2 family protein [Prolixibacteraceae bacterium]